MGDTIFAPLYKVLKGRGVSFEFFRRVDELIPSDDGSHVEKIEFTPQAEVTAEQRMKGGYEPLVDVKGLPCWRSEPRWDQLVDGPSFREHLVDFEWYAPQPMQGEPQELVRGDQFDDVVLGISICALPYVAEALIKQSVKWQQAVTHVLTTRA